MNISNIFNNITFQKKLVAKCHVGEQNNAKEASIYQLEYPQDKDYYAKCKDDTNWEKNYYLIDFIKNFEIHRPDEIHYVMENENGDTICVGVLDEHHNKRNLLRYIETAPKLSSYNKTQRNTKYIGETMLAFLVMLTKKDKTTFCVPDIAQRPTTLNFYAKVCKLNMDEPTSAYLNREEFDSFIKRNEKHTGNKIDFIQSHPTPQ